MSIESRHAIVLKQKIAEHRQTLLEALGNGAAADYGAYKQLAGQIQGLADALKLSDDADYEINGGS
jgi:hypothetical protein